jgi:hypothetical protein
MKTNFTRNFRKIYALLIGLISLSAILLPKQSLAQWSGTYGNGWLAGKYGQTWLRIGVLQNGIQKVTLPGGFQNKMNFLHLYHRGVEVPLITATNTEIEFYGVPNDGASDAWFYRSSITTPDVNERKNTYFSMFSDQSSYFLTFSATPKITLPTQNIAESGASPLNYHFKTEVKAYTNYYSHSSDYNFVSLSLIQSYFENGKGLTSDMYGINSSQSSDYLLGNPTILLPIKNLYVDENIKPKLEFLLYGRTTSSNNISVSAGKSAGSLRDVSGTNITFSGFTGIQKTYDLNLSNTVANSDLPLNGDLNVKFTSNKVTGDFSTTGIYSLTYLKVKYPQTFNMQDITSGIFTLPATADNTASKVLFTNAPVNAKIFDITDPNNPKKITPFSTGANLGIMVERQSNAELVLFISSDAAIDVSSQLFTPVFADFGPTSYDYLIIATSDLIPAALEYKAYRESSIGGGLRPLVVDIRQIYDQFNYGEPSPVAIRRFVDYMTSQGIRENHNLLLLGHSVSIGDKFMTNRELPNQVPTVGYPGSDVLLVEGLNGAPQDVPAIPVGRVNAINVTQVSNYLAKVKSYEQSTTNLGYRKTVMHINGGVYSGESQTWSDTYFKGTLNPIVAASPFSGTVINKQKPVNEFTNPFNLNISSEINTGVGFVSYFGHGNPHYTDYNIGFMSDNRRGYANEGKYPVMYFNGCGVGNIFKGSTLDYPSGYSGSDKTLPEEVEPLSSDWLLAPQKGAVALIGNSYYAFVESSRDYLYALYDQIFKKTDAQRATIGKIHRATARYIVTGNANGRVAAVDNFSLANTHQSLLNGDPALRILWLTNPLPVEWYDFQAKAQGADEVMLTWKTTSETNNSHFVIERSYNGKNFVEIGQVEGGGNKSVVSEYRFLDSDPSAGLNYYRLKQYDYPGEKKSDKFSYSRIVSVSITGENSVSVYPNPTENKVKIELNVPVSLKSWELVNLKGEIVKRGVGNETNLDKISSGIYILKVVSQNGDVYNKKIVKK